MTTLRNPPKVKQAFVVELSRTLDAVIVPRGPVRLVRGTVSFVVSDLEAEKLRLALETVQKKGGEEQ